MNKQQQQQRNGPTNAVGGTIVGDHRQNNAPMVDHVSNPLSQNDAGDAAAAAAPSQPLMAQDHSSGNPLAQTGAAQNSAMMRDDDHNTSQVQQQPPPSSPSEAFRSAQPTQQELEQQCQQPIKVETVDSKDSEERKKNAEADDQYHRMDVHDKYAAWAIHIALLAFVGLVILSILLALVVVVQYGLVAFVGLGIVVMVVAGLALTIHTIIQNDSRLQPIKRQMELGIKDIKKWVADEISAFQSEWKEHQLLLTNGEEHANDESFTDGGGGNGNSDNATPTDAASSDRNQPQSTKTTTKKKSILFRAIRPFLSVRKKISKRRKRKNKGMKEQQHNDGATTSTPSYQPPSSNVGAQGNLV